MMDFHSASDFMLIVGGMVCLEMLKRFFINNSTGWLRTSGEYVFPRAEKRLDLYHLKRALSQVFSDDEMDVIEQVIYQ
jgi:hypothetical protein